MSRSSWIGPLGLSERDARRVQRWASSVAEQLGGPSRWLLVGGLAGAAPFCIAWLIQVSMWALPTSLLLAGLMVLGAASHRPYSALSAVGVGMFVHCAVAISLTAHDPVFTAGLLEDGPAYWEKTRHWVLTGESPEYQLAWWVPAHVQLVTATVVLSYVSLGITTLYEGMYEVGLMNCYVGNLLREAHDPVTALFVGWHPWSVARGVGFLVLTYELVDLSWSRLVGVWRSTRSERIGRWAVGLSFAAIDALLKLFLLEPIRLAIAGAL